MTRTATDMVGFRSGRLTVTARAPGIFNEAHWYCLCDCGTATRPISGRKLRYGAQRSCGCARGPAMRMPETGSGIHPLVHFVFEKMQERKFSIKRLARRSGVSETVIGSLRDGRTRPKLDDMEALLNVLGYELPPPRQK